MKLSWSQPICEDCWQKKRGDRVPVRTVYPEQTTCAYCGWEQSDGIYVRDDPRNVSFPVEDEA